MYQDTNHINDDLVKKIIDENRQITSMLIHELINPLSLIKGTLQYIEMKHQEVKGYKYWDQLYDLINDMEILMSDASLLNSSFALNIKDTNLLNLIHQVVDNYKPQADTQEKHLIFKSSPEYDYILSSYPCDQDKIKQVLSNLLKNALEATSTGDYIEIIIKLDDINSPSILCIQINNNGPMIPENEIDTIFKPFVTHKSGGTGVGLALAKRIIEAHNGSIHVSSTKEVTGFTIILPLRNDL
ncbi:MAG: HAMP domain-containing histidine kinase [Clostridiales bacterium]|nr:HAMP domain-containing histidine kinase [Clostridiales bacterium]